MTSYRYTEDPNIILRDEATRIPNDPANMDWQQYQSWLAHGNQPDPYVPPDDTPVPTPEDQVLYNHENRIRELEGQPPLTLDEFLRKKGSY